MPKITPGNRLYLYQLLSRELGFGRQTLVARAEECRKSVYGEHLMKVAGGVYRDRPGM